ncbi:DUF1826 domain-containing protein, partial [Acinetobacter baumannii]|nr:DUF1826 domain-containing protein [Acinetobacter baumannii]
MYDWQDFEPFNFNMTNTFSDHKQVEV